MQSIERVERLLRVRDTIFFALALACFVDAAYWLPGAARNASDFTHDPGCAEPVARATASASPCRWTTARIVKAEKLRSMWITLAMPNGDRVDDQGPSPPTAIVDYADLPRSVQVLFFRDRYAGFKTPGGMYLCESSPLTALHELELFGGASTIACALLGTWLVRSARRRRRSGGLDARVPSG